MKRVRSIKSLFKLGKLDVSQSEPELSCKTTKFARQRDQWVRSPPQNILGKEIG
jgi:hypothetical protein